MTVSTGEHPPTHAVFDAFAHTPRLLVCCDFDGTISTLADEPSAARPVDGAIAALTALAQLPDTWAAIVSGRALIDLTRLAGVPDEIHLVGSHGAEFEVGRVLAFGPTESSLLDVVIAQVNEIAEGRPGVLVEAKTASVAVHVRQAPRDVASRVLTAVRSGPGTISGVTVIEGKEVVELAVISGGKGDALDALRSRWSITGTLFVGDDVTDESAFAALHPGDVGVKVGEGPSVAALRLPDPASVVGLLWQLVAARRVRAGDPITGQESTGDGLE